MENTIRILLIEDNPGDAFLIKFYLEQSSIKNYNLIHAEFLSSALDLLSKNEFDIILLDLNLPDSEGMNSLNEVQKHSVDSVVIVLTGLTDEELGKEAMRSGAQDLLTKGEFDGKVLNSSIRFAFERKLFLRKIKSVTIEKERADIINNLLFEKKEFVYFSYNKIQDNLDFHYGVPTFFKLLNEERPYNLRHLLQQFPKEESEKISKAFEKCFQTNKPQTIQLKMFDEKLGTKELFITNLKNEENIITACLM
ncbi:MAG: response regulator [Chitinophagaceae bacterium]|nr:MAG: response regulator [Chitinophagaceae bacterium]